jgi:hypothetical protein
MSRTTDSPDIIEEIPTAARVLLASLDAGDLQALDGEELADLDPETVEWVDSCRVEDATGSNRAVLPKPWSSLLGFEGGQDADVGVVLEHQLLVIRPPEGALHE